MRRPKFRRLMSRRLREVAEEDDRQPDGDQRQDGERDREPDELADADDPGQQLRYSRCQEIRSQRHGKDEHHGCQQVAGRSTPEQQGTGNDQGGGNDPLV